MRPVEVIAINASGGVFTANDVLTCLDAGATTVQIYSALVYEGRSVVGELTHDLAAMLRAQGAGEARVAGRLIRRRYVPGSERGRQRGDE